ncbi:putative DNA-binding transcriptional regulator YafY [Chitinophaga dinghuensis]|uniref:Putative DNA-binding transcriptional regulator YafY n=2 Tax=Chitinophaga dinghuensis TaxID=1539050 RepID=A0A327VMC6_9BACT|nr:putative DNA-binding transcriptional regulator YafY [Chitinophaga dinghuensis]
MTTDLRGNFLSPMNRIDRLTAILIQLQGKKIVKASEISERFNISLRTVYRDVKALQEAGVPIGAEAGTGYYIVDGYHLPPVMFSKEEAAALLTAEKLMEKYSDHSNEKQFGFAMEKIRSVLRGSDKDYLENLDDNIAVVKYQPLHLQGDDFPNKFLSDIQQSIGNQQVLSMEYFSFKDEVATRREIEPVGIFHMSHNWHLIAWCRLRQGYRNFRIDRIRKLQVQPERYEKAKHVSLKDYMATQFKMEGEEFEECRILMETRVVKYINSQKYYFGLVAERNLGEKTEMVFLQPPRGYFPRWLITFGNSVEVLGPDSLKEWVIKYATEIRDHYLK